MTVTDKQHKQTISNHQLDQPFAYLVDGNSEGHDIVEKTIGRSGCFVCCRALRVGWRGKDQDRNPSFHDVRTTGLLAGTLGTLTPMSRRSNGLFGLRFF